jgi:hypothetical protein
VRSLLKDRGDAGAFLVITLDQRQLWTLSRFGRLKMMLYDVVSKRPEFR